MAGVNTASPRSANTCIIGNDKGVTEKLSCDQ